LEWLDELFKKHGCWIDDDGFSFDRSSSSSSWRTSLLLQPREIEQLVLVKKKWSLMCPPQSAAPVAAE
jgi:hypothetical protein